MHEEHLYPPYWLEILGWLSLALGFASALLIILDILRGNRQKMWIMNVVYPVTALYSWPATTRSTGGRRRLRDCR